MTATRKRGDHVIAHDATGPHPYRMECLHCGATHDSVMPVAIRMWLAGAEQFGKDHARCKPATTTTKETP